MKKIIGSTCLLLAIFGVACTSGPSGTYTDTMGSVILELKPGGKANFTFGGDVEDCTFSTSGNKLSLTCKDSTPTVFTIHDDGSLTGPPGAFMPILRKQK
jgi:hypothetical protein